MFVSPFNVYKFCVMPFTLDRIPATFQKLMNEVMQDVEKFAYLLRNFMDNSFELSYHIKVKNEVRNTG